LKIHESPEALAKFNEGYGFLPPRKSAIAQAQYMQSNVMKKVADNMAKYGEPFKIIPVWQKFSLIITPMIEAVVLGKKTAEEALAEAEKDANDIMKDYPDWPDVGG